MDNQHFLDLYSVPVGDGAPVVLVHDWGVSLRLWELLIPDLLNANLSVYPLDMLGHGQSPHPTDPALYYPQMLYTAFRRWIDQQNFGHVPILVGQGLGGTLCLRYTLGHPYKVAKLILLNPLCGPAQLSNRFVKLLGQANQGHLADEQALLGLTPTLPEVLSKRVLKEYRSASPYITRIPALVPNLIPDLLTLPTRSLLLWTEADPTLNTAEFPTYLEKMKDAVGQSLGALGHYPQLEDPAETNRAILKFSLGIQ
jgi:pimeloyl-ACP methyl ester carboxylesterase